MLHRDTLGAKRKAFLSLLVDKLPVEKSYLAGGTALALMLGHRESIDFDWFSPVDFDPEALASNLSRLGRLEITETTKGTLHSILDGIRVTWLHYPNPLMADLVQPPDMQGLALASLLDIGLMKWATGGEYRLGGPGSLQV
ncbi:MAG: nucleotidyl transferase AbiEii/AbiGii toxin family protein [Bacillota bacterium]